MIYLAIINILIFRIIGKQQTEREINLERNPFGELAGRTSSSFALFAIVLLFIMCNIPRLLLNQAEMNLRLQLELVEFCQTQEEISRLSLLIHISHFCLIINSSANVLLYYSVIKMAKIKIKGMRRCCTGIFLTTAPHNNDKYLFQEECIELSSLEKNEIGVLKGFKI